MHSKATLIILAALLLHSCSQSQNPQPPAQETAAPTTAVTYGANPAVGKTFTHDGIQLYYEVYGEGEPLVLIHGNGGSIRGLAAQIDHFRKRNKVIVMDSRDHGQSADSPGKITYELMTDDIAALIGHLGVGPVNVLGWSDGGIEALLLGIRHPDKVKKLAIMAANLSPSGIHPKAAEVLKRRISDFRIRYHLLESRREAKVAQMARDEPHIDAKALEAITAPALVMAGDHDLIADEHTLEIFHHLPNSQLCIFPNATHMVPYDNPVLFDTTVELFFDTPFVKKDRVEDLLKSVEKMLGLTR